MTPSLPPYLTRVDAPSSSNQRSSSTSYDYSGLEELAKKRDELSQTRAAKYQALYNGDVAGSSSIEKRIRDLVASINDPTIPPVRVASQSSSSSRSGDGGSLHGHHGALEPEAIAAEYGAARNDVAADPKAVSENRLRARLASAIV